MTWNEYKNSTKRSELSKPISELQVAKMFHTQAAGQEYFLQTVP